VLSREEFNRTEGDVMGAGSKETVGPRQEKNNIPHTPRRITESTMGADRCDDGQCMAKNGNTYVQTCSNTSISRVHRQDFRDVPLKHFVLMRFLGWTKKVRLTSHVHSS
jgi:hypothetical protein